MLQVFGGSLVIRIFWPVINVASNWRQMLNALCFHFTACVTCLWFSFVIYHLRLWCLMNCVTLLIGFFFPPLFRDNNPSEKKNRLSSMWTDGSNGRKGAQFRAMILIKLLIYSQKKLSHMNHGSATSTFSEFIIFFFYLSLWLRGHENKWIKNPITNNKINYSPSMVIFFFNCSLTRHIKASKKNTNHFRLCKSVILFHWIRLVFVIRIYFCHLSLPIFSLFIIFVKYPL